MKHLLLLLLLAACSDQAYIPQAAAANASRPCNLDGLVAQKVTVSGTTAATANVMDAGVMRVICTSASHMVVGASGVTAGTSDTYIAAGVPEYFMTGSSKKAAFIQDAAGGSCYVLSCQ